MLWTQNYIEEESEKLEELPLNGWELFDMEADRTELNNLAQKNPKKLRELTALYDQWKKSWSGQKNKKKTIS